MLLATSISRRALLCTATIALSTLSLTAFRTAGEPERGTELKSAYFAEFTGVGHEGRDMVWRGAAAGAAVGDLTIRLAHAGRAIHTAKPRWPVEGMVFVSGEDPTRSLAAEVKGTIDWRKRQVQLAGEVTDGYLKGAHLTQTAALIGYDLSGEMRFAPTTLATGR